MKNTEEKEIDLSFMDAPRPITASQKQAMARLWADEEIKNYIMHLIQMANKLAMEAINKGNQQAGMFYSNRFTVLKQLLEVAKNEFINFEAGRKNYKMPLKRGKSKKTVSKNISEFHKGKTYEATKKKFGKAKADKQAVAVALSTARKSKGKKKKKKVDGRDYSNKRRGYFGLK